jgi:hypothetical protein
MGVIKVSEQQERWLDVTVFSEDGDVHVPTNFAIVWVGVDGALHGRVSAPALDTERKWLMKEHLKSTIDILQRYNEDKEDI